MCYYQSVCYSASIVDFECQNIIVKQPLLAIVITKPLITIVAAALFRSGSLVVSLRGTADCLANYPRRR